MFDRKKYYKEYWKKHKEHLMLLHKEWCEENPDYFENHEYSKRAKDNRYRYTEQWRKDNPEKRLEIAKKSQNKRKRNLGFFPLNEYFKGSEAHHISQNFVIYIPEEIHRGISHCLETGKNMNEINKLAISLL